jgi:hypothetical protein
MSAMSAPARKTLPTPESQEIKDPQPVTRAAAILPTTVRFQQLHELERSENRPRIENPALQPYYSKLT